MGNITASESEIARAKLDSIEAKAQRKMKKAVRKFAKRRLKRGAKPKKRSVYTISGGAPSLGKRR